MSEIWNLDGNGLPEWLEVEPEPRFDREGRVTNGAQRYGKSRGRTAELIRRRMVSSSRSQGSLALALRMKEESLKLILSGEMLPTLGTVVEMAALFGCAIEDLVDLEEVRERREEARAARSRSGAAARRKKTAGKP